jgi:hypothetical protein
MWLGDKWLFMMVFCSMRVIARWLVKRPGDCCLSRRTGMSLSYVKCDADEW